MATYSSTLAWEIPWTEEPGGLQSHEVTKSWTQLSVYTNTHTHTHTHTHACTVISKTHSQAKLNYLEVKNSFNIFIGLKKMYIFVLENLKYLFLTLYKKKLPNS